VQEREQAIRKKKELFVARREKQTKLEELERKIEVAEMVIFRIYLHQTPDVHQIARSCV
jgi:hypothetical protein